MRTADVVSVRDFGAVADGVADDYAAFLAAHATLPVTGGTIVVPDATAGPSAGWAIDLQANGSSLGGFALIANTSGQLIVSAATAGANPRTLSNIAQLDAAGISITGMPSSDPGVGSKRLWYDAADGNRVKFSS